MEPDMDPVLIPESDGHGKATLDVLGGFVRILVTHGADAIHGDLTPDIARKLASALYDAARQAEQQGNPS